MHWNAHRHLCQRFRFVAVLTVAVMLWWQWELFKCHKCSGRPFKVNDSKMQAVEVYFRKSMQLTIYCCFFFFFFKGNFRISVWNYATFLCTCVAVCYSPKHGILQNAKLQHSHVTLVSYLCWCAEQTLQSVITTLEKLLNGT